MNALLLRSSSNVTSESANAITREDSKLLDHVIDTMTVGSLFEEVKTSQFAHMHLKHDRPQTILSTSSVQQPKQIPRQPAPKVNKSSNKHKHKSKKLHKHHKHIERPQIPEHLRKTSCDHTTVQIQQGEGALDLIRRRTGNK